VALVTVGTNVKSFLCEHTAEFILVPKMRDLLTQRFAHAIPIAYWKTREGNSVASSRHANRLFRMIAMFARRPKLAPVGQEVFGKLNKQLFEFALEAWHLGIPTFAGFPVISSLWELTGETAVIWFLLRGDGSSDAEFSVNRSTLRCDMIATGGQSTAVASDDQVLAVTAERTRVYGWEDAIESIDRLRRTSVRPSTRYLFGEPGYKPIYFLMPEP
jgi:hypothetical protein